MSSWHCCKCGEYTDPQYLDYVTGECGNCQDGAPMKENKFEKIGREVGKLVGEKNLAYGDSFSRSGECLRQMYPDGISPEKMDDALIIVRILDKLFRIANQKDAFGESPFKDICGYSLLGINKSNEE